MATEVTRRAALSGYRTLLRTVTRVFGADEQAVREGRAQVREQFRLHADERDPKKIESLLADVEEVRSFLTHNVVQGRLNERGAYEVKLEPHHADPENNHIHLQAARPPEEIEDFGLEEACHGEEKGHGHAHSHESPQLGREVKWSGP